MSRTAHRLNQLLLQALELAAAGPVTVKSVAEALMLSNETARNFVRKDTAAFLHTSTPANQLPKYYELTTRGREKLQALRAHFPDLASRTHPSLGEKALQLVLDAGTAGHDSTALAEKLQVTEPEIVEALAMHVASRQLITCSKITMIEGEAKQSVAYRVSTGTPLAVDWKGQADQTWTRREAAGVDIDAVHRRHDDVIEAGDAGTPAAAPGPAIAAPRPYFTFDTAPAEAAAAEPSSGAPDVGEAIEGAPREAYACALFSDGRFLQVIDGVDVWLDADKTRQLVHYLDHLSAGEMLFALTRSAA